MIKGHCQNHLTECGSGALNDKKDDFVFVAFRLHCRGIYNFTKVVG